MKILKASSVFHVTLIQPAIFIQMKICQSYWRQEDLIPMIITSIEPGDIVMVKGSHGSRMYSAVDAFLQQNGAGKASFPRLVNGG